MTVDKILKPSVKQSHETKVQNSKLKEIDDAIRYHYFESDCSHVTYEACCRAILHKIIKITGYEERSKLVV